MPSSLIDQILNMNAIRSQEFSRNHQERREFRVEHPTEIIATMCMDGRVNLRLATEIPFGLITPFRNIGGKYRVGWPMMRQSLNDLEHFANHEQTLAMLIATYHWSIADQHLGCRGFNYDRSAALASMLNFRNEVLDCYHHPRRQPILWPLVVGMETENESLVIHGQNDMFFIDLSTQRPEQADGDWLKHSLAKLFPDYPPQILNDLLPLITGNLNHLKRVQANERTKFPEHRERVLAIGQGYDWLDNDNFALIIGPCAPDLDDAIVTAAAIIRDNLQQQRIPQGGVLMVNTPYRKPWHRNGAIAQSKYLASFAAEHIGQSYPDMVDFFKLLVGVTNLNTREYEVCDQAA